MSCGDFNNLSLLTSSFFQWERCLFFFGLLCNLLIFDIIILLLIVLVLWWCVFIVTDFEVYKHIPMKPYGATISIITMTAPFTAYCLIFGVFSTKYCRKLGQLWSRLNCVSVVREPPEERVAKLRQQRQPQQHIEIPTVDEDSNFTAML